jgi:MFS family permease
MKPIDESHSGIGGIFWIPFLTCWGRLPVLFWTGIIGTLFTLGTALTPNFEGYYGLRALMCFFLAVGETSGLAFIQDVFFFHQHAKKIGIWTAVFLTCPYVGPMFGYFVVAGTNEWRNVFWMTLGLEIFSLALTVFFVDETWY